MIPSQHEHSLIILFLHNINILQFDSFTTLTFSTWFLHNTNILNLISSQHHFINCLYTTTSCSNAYFKVHWPIQAKKEPCWKSWSLKTVIVMLMSVLFEISPACRLVGSRDNYISSFSVGAEFYYFNKKCHVFHV